MYNPYEEKKDESYTKKDTSVSLKDGIRRLLNAYKLNGRLDESRIKADWEVLVGKMIASRTTNIYLNQTTLIITVNSSPLKAELNNFKERIIKHINKTYKKTVVEQLVIR